MGPQASEVTMEPQPRFRSDGPRAPATARSLWIAGSTMMMVGLGWTWGCGSDGPPGPARTLAQDTASVILSDPVASPLVNSSRVAASASSPGLVYVSEVPGTVPDGDQATIWNLHSGSSVLTAMISGGFDPVPVEASAGDTLRIDVHVTTGPSLVSRSYVVPPRLSPRVVRTYPNHGKRDVALNTGILVVFSEPVDSRTLTPASLQLLRGTSTVAGTVSPLAGTATSVVFTPAALLDANTDYQLVVTRAVRDLGGDALEAGVTVDFTTGSVSGGVPVRVNVIPDTATVIRQERYQLSIDTLRDANGRVLSGLPTTWTSEDPSVAMVDANGLVTGVDVGSARVTATVEGISGAAVIRVTLPLDSADVIAFASDQNGNRDIYLADAHGFIRLTTDPAWDDEPAWSPDGRRIAFVSDRDGNYDIYVMNADGTGVLRLTNSGSPEFEPTWSPDGQKIAFNRGGRIFVMNAVDGSGITLLTGGAHPAWSPDGTKIAFDRNDDIWVMNADGTGAARWIPGDGIFGYHHLAWSPDGTKDSFASYAIQCCFESPDLYVGYTDRSGAFRVIYYPGVDDDPTWSPDGSKIAFVHHPAFTESGAIEVLRIGSWIAPITGGYHPAWKPR